MRYEVIIPGKPVSKQRPRVTSRGTYTPKATRDYERTVALLCKQVARTPIEGPCRVEIAVYYTDRRRRDLDNAVKSLTDGANGILYADDSQIVELVARKHLKAEEAKAVMIVEEVRDD